MFLCSLLTFAQFSGSGSGTESDPYLILNPIQLNQMRNFLNQENVYFKMMADVDLTEFLEDENPSQGWQPVGTSSAPFKGILDGNGQKITGFWINRSSSNYIGLFGYTTNARITNVNLLGNTVKGNDNIGFFAGYSKNTTFGNCTLSGSVSGNTNVGGCIGCSENIILTGINSSVEVLGTDYIGGLLGKGTNGVNIENCSLDCDKIKGNNYVGGICGSSSNGDNYYNGCHVVSSIFGANNVGGICGYTKYYTNNISNCGFIGKIIATSNVGGIAGEYTQGVSYSWKFGGTEEPSLLNCYVIADIICQGDNIGGLVGITNADEVETGPLHGRYTNFHLNNIGCCYFSGNIQGGQNVGGIAGYKKGGRIISCYSNATISGSKFIGGICGVIESYGIAVLKSNIANILSIKATIDGVGRIYGQGSATIAIGSSDENKALNRAIVIKAGVAQEVSDDEQNGTGVSPTTLKLKATYVAMGWDFTDTWEIQETECYPYFKTQTAPPVIQSQVVSGATTVSGKCVSGATVTLDIDGVKQEKVFGGTTFTFNVDPLQAGHEIRVSAKADGKEQSYFTTEVVSFLGKGTESDPYQISTAADLTQSYRKGYYKLMNDIDLTSYINQYYSTEGWESIGRDGSETVYFDGNNHKVTGLWCNSTRGNTGLFSCFANGYIKNLTVETASGKQVKGGANTGILIGKLINGTIENCKVSGSVADGTPVGGIVGLLDGGKILLSQATVTVNTTGDNTYVGGLVGEITSGEIDQCVSSGTLTATGKNSQAGGLVGKNSATITNSYSNVAVTSAYCAAGLVAYNYGLVEKCYATGDLSSMNYGAGVIGYNDGENAVIRNCVAMNQKIDVTYESQSAQSGGYGQRIIGGYKNGAPDPELNNYALKTMQLSVNDIPQKVYDDIMNGMAKTEAQLTKSSTYQSLGWDMSVVWDLKTDKSYPWLRNNMAVVGVEIPTMLIIGEGKTETLTSTLYPSISSLNNSLVWKSSNTAVATVTSSGKVKGIKTGTATITCTSVATGVSATCIVTVGTVKLDQTEVAVKKGKKLTLTPVFYPSSLEDKSVTWKSSNTKVATVSSDGEVYGVKAGTATITCTSNAIGVSTTCKVTVSYVKFEESEYIVEKYKTITLTPTVYPSTLTDKSVTWKSSNTKVATVSSDGEVYGVKAGTATITCTSKATGVSTTCKVTVSYVKFEESEYIVEKYKTITLTPTVYPSSLTDKSVTWKSSNTKVATVTSNGKVTGVKAGTATITCTSKATGVSTTCKVTVGYVKLDQTEAIVEKTKTMTLKATVYPSKLEDKSVTWTSSNTAVATVTSKGKVKGIKAGKATITCTSNATGLSTTCKVTVGYVKLDQTEVSVKKGKTLTLTATVYPSSLTDKSVTWESSDKSVATVTSAGKVKGIAAGTATITCTSNATGLSTTCIVTVKATSGSRSLEGDDDEATGIENLDKAIEPFDVYDLRGQKVCHQVTSLDGLPAGVYIVNGRKVLKK